MKRVFLTVMILSLLLSACSFGKNESMSDSVLGTTAETTTQVTTLPRELKGDMTIRKGTKLDTTEFDKIGPLIDGKVITFKNVGKPYLETSYETAIDCIDCDISFFEQEVGYLDCKTGRKVILCNIKPITPPNTYVYLDGTYAYLVYTKIPQNGIKGSLTKDEYQDLVVSCDSTILQINVKTNEIKEYNVKTIDPVEHYINCIRFSVQIIGQDSLFLSYYITMDDDTINCYDRLDLSSGEISRFYSGEYKYEMSEGDEDLYLNSVSDDKAFFTYEKLIDNEWIYGFKVYDTNMKLIKDVEVARKPMRYFFSAYVDNDDVYYRIFNGTYDTDGAFTGDEEFIKYEYNDRDYIHKPFDDSHTGIDFYAVYPGCNSDFPYEVEQTVSEDNSSGIHLTGNNKATGSFDLKIDIDGLKIPSSPGDYGYCTDYSGDFIAQSGDIEENNFSYYYISKEEIMRALYGE